MHRAGVVLEQLRDARAEPHRHVAFEQAHVEPRDQRVAEHETGAALVMDAIGEIAAQEARAEQRIGRRPPAAQQARRLAAGDHHAAEEHQFADRPRDAIEVRAEQTPVESRRLQRPAAECCAGQVLAIVGVMREGFEAYAGAGFEQREQLRAGCEKRFAQFAIGFGADERVEVDACRVGVGGNPHRPRRARAGAADVLRALHDEYARAFEHADQRRGQARDAGADDDEIERVVGAVRHGGAAARRRGVCRSNWGGRDAT